MTVKRNPKHESDDERKTQKIERRQRESASVAGRAARVESESAPAGGELVWTPAIGALLDLALEEDLGRGDVTTALLALEGQATARIVCRELVVVCGLPLAGWLVARAGGGLELEPLAAEGERLEAGGALAGLRGPVAAILRIERTLLNFLMRLCGVATLTRRYVEAVSGTPARIVDTRKTMPGWRPLDKYAVRVGGGSNHRFDLGSGILVKDNHVAAAGGVAEVVRRARSGRVPHCLRLEVEVETIEAALEAAAAGVEVLLLDNMSPEAVREVARSAGDRVLLEVSGGINLRTVRAYAEAGAQIISVGGLTHSAPAVDLSLDLEPPAPKVAGGC